MWENVNVQLPSSFRLEGQIWDRQTWYRQTDRQTDGRAGGRTDAGDANRRRLLVRRKFV